MTTSRTTRLAITGAIVLCASVSAASIRPATAQETLFLQTIHSTGTNLSLATAQPIDLSSGAGNSALWDTAIANFDATNGDLVHQNASSFTPLGQDVSPLFFKFGSSSVEVDSAVNVLGHATVSGSPGATNYFSFAETSGSLISMFGTATAPANQGTEIFLYDNSENLVAIANGNASDGRSSLIDFTVPSGGDGTWSASITQGTSFTAPIDYSYQFKLPFRATSLFTTHVLGNGTLSGGSLGLYSVNVFDGDNLSFDVHATTPSTPTQLDLFDNNGNLVAIANGNGSDGFSSLIDFTVPSGDAGDWRIEVLPSASEPTPKAYAYDLAIQGASGLGPVNPNAVPEPATWIMLLAGFGALCLALSGRSRRRLALAGARTASPPI
jgi:hypothetical protein